MWASSDAIGEKKAKISGNALDALMVTNEWSILYRKLQKLGNSKWVVDEE